MYDFFELIPYLDQSEFDIECIIRDVDPELSGADDKLKSAILEEQKDNSLIPQHSHVLSDPNKEIELCRSKADELSKLLDKITPESNVNLIQTLLIRSLHYNARAMRVRFTHGDILSVNSIINKLKRLISRIQNVIEEWFDNQNVIAPVSKKIVTMSFSPVGSPTRKESVTSKNTNENLDILNSISSIHSKSQSHTELQPPLTDTTTTGAVSLPVDSTHRSTFPISCGTKPKKTQERKKIDDTFGEWLMDNTDPTDLKSTHELPNALNLSVDDYFQGLEQRFTQSPRFKSRYANNLLVNPDRTAISTVRSNNIQRQITERGAQRVRSHGIIDSECEEDDPDFISRHKSTKNSNSSNRKISFVRNFKPTWKLEFDGSGRGLDIRDFIFRLETLANRDGFRQEQLVQLIFYFVSGVAESWLWVFIRNHPDSNWIQIKSAFLARFSSFEAEYETRRYIEQRLQKPRESFDNFVLDIETHNGHLEKRIPENELLHIIRHNMSWGLQNSTLTLPFNSIEELRSTCHRFERLWALHDRSLPVNRPNQARRPHLDEINDPITQLESNLTHLSINDGTDGQLNQPYVSAVTHDARNPFIPICWNCFDIGHVYQDCLKPIERVFCYGCGTDNVYKNNCMKCAKKNSLNFKPNVTATGGNRSVQQNCPPQKNRQN